jgi:hypothetical protein
LSTPQKIATNCTAKSIKWVISVTNYVNNGSAENFSNSRKEVITIALAGLECIFRFGASFRTIARRKWRTLPQAADTEFRFLKLRKQNSSLRTSWARFI